MRKCNYLFAFLLLNIFSVYGMELRQEYGFVKKLSQNSPQRYLYREKAVDISSTNQHIDGGITEVDPNDIKYFELAKESLQKYLQDTGADRHDVVKVLKATEQIVAGTMTRIDFNAAPTDEFDDHNVMIRNNGVKVYNNNIITCHSEIWNRPWINSKIIKVDCW